MNRDVQPDWPPRLTEPARIRFLCGAVIVVSLALLAASFWTSDQGRTLGGAGPQLGNDFAGLYAVATFLNESHSADLYDFGRQDRLYHALFPKVPPHETLPYVHPPFVAAALRPLALLPYEWAFAVWLLISAGLYVLGMFLLFRAVSFPSERRSDALLIALAFEPFVMECWLGGQLSSVGFCAIALAVLCQQRGRPLTAGVALGLCVYKPTLLLLLVPMLLVSRSWRALAGIALTAACLGAAGVIAAGWSNSVAFADVLLGFARQTAGSGAMQLRLWKYVDLNSSLQLLCGGRSEFHWLLFVGIAAAPIVCLVWQWRRLRGAAADQAALIWAATLTWTPILNLYVGVYDTLIIVPGVILTAAALMKSDVDELWRRRLIFLVAAAFIVPWIAQPFARLSGIQLDTLAIAALGAYELVVAGMLAAPRPLHDSTNVAAPPVPAGPAMV